MNRFPTAGHLVSWAKLCPRTIQSGTKTPAGKTGKGNPYLKGVLGEAAAAAASTDTFLGERYRRLVKRRGKLKALVAVARSILVIIWHLLADPAARFHDLGADYHTNRIDKDRKTRNHIRQLEALGYTVTLDPAARPDPHTQLHNPTRLRKLRRVLSPAHSPQYFPVRRSVLTSSVASSRCRWPLAVTVAPTGMTSSVRPALAVRGGRGPARCPTACHRL